MRRWLVVEPWVTINVPDRPGAPDPDLAVEVVWVAIGLRKPWRVVSERRTFGEFDDPADSRTLRDLLIAGNDGLEGLA